MSLEPTSPIGVGRIVEGDDVLGTRLQAKLFRGSGFVGRCLALVELDGLHCAGSEALDVRRVL